MSLIRALDNGSSIRYDRRPGSPLHRLSLMALAIFLVICLSACNSKKYLAEDQSFLRDNKLSLKSSHRISNKSELYEDLATLYRQSATRTVAGLPRHTFYYRYQEKLKKNPEKKRRNEEEFLIKNKPVIFDSLLAAQTCLDFEKYLALKGYRSAHASFKSKTSDKETTVTYHVDPGPRLYIDQFTIAARDSTLLEILDQETEVDPVIKSGVPLDISLYNQERLRIVRLLQNDGYAMFDESFVSPLEVDTSGGNVTATMRLYNPTDSTTHKKFFVGSVNIFPDYSDQGMTYFDTTINNITYSLADSTFFSIKPLTLERNVFLQKGRLTRYDDFTRTYKNLNRIELVRFVSPVVSPDTTSQPEPVVDYTFRILKNKKIDFMANTDLTYSTIGAREKRSLAGIFLNAYYRDRNAFRGAEVMTLNTDFGVEFNFKNRSTEGSSKELFNTINAGLRYDISFPRFMDPLRMYGLIGRSRNPDKKPLIGRNLHRMLAEDASSRLGLGYNYVSIRDLYEYHAFNIALNYDVQPDIDQNRRLTIDRVGFDLFVPDAKPAFEAILSRNPFQKASFGNQLFTGFLFRNYLYEFNSKEKPKAGYFKVLHSVELSGLEMLGINSLFSPGRELVLGPSNNPDRNVKFSHFTKGEFDIRYYLDLGRSAQFATKFNAGVATTLGPYTSQVPYVKQFYAGGPLSNRGWQIRELGPGSYEDTSVVDPNLPFYQTGDIKLDMSAELRFKLFWYFEGALFVDAGNIWTMREDTLRPGSQFTADFLDQLAVAFGYGLRLNVEFFILRFDFGYKLRSPYPVDGSHLLRENLRRFPNDGELQIAVGLPF